MPARAVRTGKGTPSSKRAKGAKTAQGPRSKGSGHLDRRNGFRAETESKTSESSRKRKATSDGVRPKSSKRQHISTGVPPEEHRPALSTAPTEPLVVAVFGTGDCGELGLGPKAKEALRPRINPFLDPANAAKAFDVVQLDCGGMHVVALTKDNKIISWGVNDRGALGRDTSWDGGLRDMDAGSDSDDDEALNPYESTPAEVSAKAFPSDTTIVQVAAGDSCSFALTDVGDVYGWGTFLDSEGHSFFGYDEAGRMIDVQYTPRRVARLSNIVQLACGANHALALDNKGNVWGWGIGEQNQLGRRLLQRHALQALVPQRVEVCRNNAKYIASGLYHSFAVDRNDDVWAWGLDSYGQVGSSKVSGDEHVSSPRAVKVPGLSGKNVTVLSGGQHHSAAVTAHGQCLVWGRVDGGQLGLEFDPQQLADETLILRDINNNPRICTRPTVVPNLVDAAFVSCGTGHTIFVTKAGKAYGAGFGTMGQLGMGDEDEVSVAQPVVGKAIKDKVLSWAGAAGQFSLVAGAVDEPRPAL